MSTLRVPALPAGIYFCRIKGSGLKAFAKFTAVQ
jgi:hypothetical protein